MVAVPGDLAVTFPVELTVATDLLLELHVTLFFVLRTVSVLVELTVIVAEEEFNLMVDADTSVVLVVRNKKNNKEKEAKKMLLIYFIGIPPVGTNYNTI